jgi:hypothetical protein
MACRRGPCTVYVLCTYCECAVCAVYVLCTCCVCAVYVLCMCCECAVYVLCMVKVSFLPVQCTVTSLPFVGLGPEPSLMISFSNPMIVWLFNDSDDELWLCTDRRTRTRCRCTGGPPFCDETYFFGKKEKKRD